MDKATAGWSTFIVALAMMSALLSNDVGKLVSWSQAWQPAFVAIIMAHFATVVLAFAGGKMIPSARDASLKRSTDDMAEPKP